MRSALLSFLLAALMACQATPRTAEETLLIIDRASLSPPPGRPMIIGVVPSSYSLGEVFCAELRQACGADSAVQVLSIPTHELEVASGEPITWQPPKTSLPSFLGAIRVFYASQWWPKLKEHVSNDKLCANLDVCITLRGMRIEYGADTLACAVECLGYAALRSPHPEARPEAVSYKAVARGGSEGLNMTVRKAARGVAEALGYSRKASQ